MRMVSARSVTYPARRLALPVSLALHLAFGVWVEVRAGEPEPQAAPAEDRWAGHGIEVATESAPVPPAAVERSLVAPPRTERAEPAPRTTAVRDRIARPRSAEAAIAAPSQASTRTASATSSAENSGAPSAAAQTFGAQGLPPGVRHLPKAFARAIALANRTDPRWRTVPPGTVGEASLSLAVDDDGALGRLVYPRESEAANLPAVVKKLFENTALLLASGKFSLDASALSPGTMTIRVRVAVEQGPARADDADANELQALDYEPPRAGKPGHGAFLLNSGRRVVSWISLE
jgi:hypothetical protein